LDLNDGEIAAVASGNRDKAGLPPGDLMNALSRPATHEGSLGGSAASTTGLPDALNAVEWVSPLMLTAGSWPSLMSGLHVPPQDNSSMDGYAVR
jgi:hypothetical protein